MLSRLQKITRRLFVILSLSFHIEFRNPCIGHQPPWGRSTPYNGLYGEAPLEKDTCSTLHGNEWVGISEVQVYEIKTRFVIYTYFMTGRYTKGAATICQWKVYLRGTFSDKNGMEKVRGRTSGKNLSALIFFSTLQNINLPENMLLVKCKYFAISSPMLSMLHQFAFANSLTSRVGVVLKN